MANSIKNFAAHVRSTLRFYRHERRQSQSPRTTPLGFRLMGSQAMEDGTFEPEETAIFQRCIADCDVLINVGANVGYYCCLALQAGKHVVAYEPMPGNQRLLYKNIWANDWQDRIEIFPVALSDQPGVLKIYGGGTGASLISGWAGAQDYSLVPASTLDLTLHDRFGRQRLFLLVDIEGAELSMLRGAQNLLARQPKPTWLVEIAVSEHQPAGVALNPNLLATFDLFWQAGYQAWTAQSKSRLVTRDEVEAIAASGHDTLGTHNFLFIE
ncbi:MAG: FkbM family methyltransferase [Pirellulaceae bacterium]|nr:FkbM family methyltransferase [Pirellulaceae bacterium]